MATPVFTYMSEHLFYLIPALMDPEDSNLQPKDYEDEYWAVRLSAMECNSLNSIQDSATDQCEDYGQYTLASA